MGRAMVLGAAAMAQAAGNPRVCIFGVEGTVGEALYRACGFVEVGAQIEWTEAPRSGRGMTTPLQGQLPPERERHFTAARRRCPWP